ncbi:related to a component of the yeast U3 snoRNP Rrp9p [Rhynchosporium agropyri]|uniref:Related to a component of the yeast U3 snoRNP Rrp9p n=1 Tax=Rhynchosporium agropyri TaxID=914238 RepID=A0A1E1K7Y2_9HELO|nr:related to a component of the yeast U3 snoRNP Rrp9p [Rhynchosporium agropyri]
MSSFFTLPSAKKRKRTDGSEPNPKKRIASTAQTSKSKPPRKPQRDESISGSDNESDGGNPRDSPMDFDPETASSSEDEGAGGSDEEETAAERRLRLAERYLSNIRSEVETSASNLDPSFFDAEEIDRDLIAERLIEDVAESKGRMYRDKLSSELDFAGGRSSWFRWNSESVTSVATCAPWAYTVDRGVGLCKWRVQDLPEDQWLPKKDSKGKKKRKSKSKKETPPPKRKPEQVAFVRGDRRESKNNGYQGHVDTILTVAASQDGKFVVTGGKDRRIVVWDAATLKCLRVFSQHRDSVCGLAFRRGTNQLYSASKDRTIKIWSLDELAYVETLFGHQDEVIDVSALAQERCVSVGARDRTARLWKVVEETQLVFRGGGAEKKSRKSSSIDKSRPSVQEGSIDRVAMIDEDMFITGSDNGSLSLWEVHKKKPLFVLPLCHGVDPVMKKEDVSAEKNPQEEVVPMATPRWITALATIPYSDVILSGSWDGEVRAWKVSEDKKKIERVGTLGSSGVIPHTTPSLSTGTSKVNGDELANVEDLSSDLVTNNGTDLPPTTGPIRGVINDISLFERGDRGKDGVCVVVAVGKEHRMGRWIKVPGGKNGGVVFEIPRVPAPKSNGDSAQEESVDA